MTHSRVAYRDSFGCGPLEVSVEAETPALRDKVAESLCLHNVEWAEQPAALRIEARMVDAPAEGLPGRFLETARMRVDRVEGGLAATCDSGASCVYAECERRWSIAVPANGAEAEIPEDVELLVGLALTTGWRSLGWAPLHAGAVARGDVCALLCAPSGGGKSTLIAALLRRGWHTLGDDKLLIRDDGTGPVAEALIHNFNLHPRTRDWFPEVGDLTRLPRYSAWTEKRKVRIEDIWPSATCRTGRPTHLVRLERGGAEGTLDVRVLPRSEVLSILLRQVVIPNDAAAARPLLATLGALAGRLEGLEVVLGEDLYGDPDRLAALEDTLR